MFVQFTLILLYVDEVSAFDALQTLANLSLMMPDTTNENGKTYADFLVFIY